MYKTFKVTRQAHGEKIDKALSLYLPTISRRNIRRALDNGTVYLNNRLERFASKVVHEGDTIQLTDVLKSSDKKEKFNFEEPFILFEDRHILAINKPAFVLSQKTVNRTSLDAETLLANYLKEKKRRDIKELFLCHRLDKETTGVLLFAKSKADCDWIMDQFKNRKCQKTYEALCFGLPKEKSWVQKDFLSTMKNKEQKVRIVQSGGKTAITEFTCLKRSATKKISHMLCKPQTGRTHQIRVQLAKCSLPILGDKKYYMPTSLSQKTFLTYSHHFLHAKAISLKTSSQGEMVTIEAPYHKDFLKNLSSLF